MDKPQTKDKPQWIKPELTVLVRSNPEEQVLAACKNIFSGSGATNYDSSCMADMSGGGCENCSGLIGS